MRLIFKVHYKNGFLVSYIEAEARSSRRVDDNYEYGYLHFKDGFKILVRDIQNVEYEWKD